MRQRTNRRVFLMHSALAGVGLGQGVKVLGRGPAAGEKLRIAIVGTGGMGRSHVEDAHVKAEHVVALCDIDEHNLDAAAKVHPEAEKFNDFRKMLDEMGKEIDAVTAPRPTTRHAVGHGRGDAAGQARLLPEAADAHGLRGPRPRRAGREEQGRHPDGQPGALQRRRPAVVEIVRAGVIGPVREVHAWTNRPIWPQGIDRPKDARRRPRARPLGPLARPLRRAALPRRDLPPLRLARLVGLRHRRPRRHGLPHRQHRVLGLDLRHPTAVEAEASRTIPRRARSGDRSATSSPPAATCRP